MSCFSALGSLCSRMCDSCSFVCARNVIVVGEADKGIELLESMDKVGHTFADMLKSQQPDKEVAHKRKKLKATKEDDPAIVQRENGEIIHGIVTIRNNLLFSFSKEEGQEEGNCRLQFLDFICQINWVERLQKRMPFTKKELEQVSATAKKINEFASYAAILWKEFSQKTTSLMKISSSELQALKGEGISKKRAQYLLENLAKGDNLKYPQFFNLEPRIQKVFFECACQKFGDEFHAMHKDKREGWATKVSPSSLYRRNSSVDNTPDTALPMQTSDPHSAALHPSPYPGPVHTPVLLGGTADSATNRHDTATGEVVPNPGSSSSRHRRAVGVQSVSHHNVVLGMQGSSESQNRVLQNPQLSPDPVSTHNSQESHHHRLNSGKVIRTVVTTVEVVNDDDDEKKKMD